MHLTNDSALLSAAAMGLDQLRMHSSSSSSSIEWVRHAIHVLSMAWICCVCAARAPATNEKKQQQQQQQQQRQQRGQAREDKYHGYVVCIGIACACGALDQLHASSTARTLISVTAYGRT
jgi:uncharacterized membrane protein YidH (DUF202 family)